MNEMNSEDNNKMYSASPKYYSPLAFQILFSLFLLINLYIKTLYIYIKPI